jgi:exonuclease III
MGVSGFDNLEFLRGRPYGGCAIFWRKDIVADISIINTGSNRVCALKLSVNMVNLLLINVYMPAEGTESNTDDFMLQLSLIDNLIQQNQQCQIILGGDFNVDFSRCWSHSTLLNEFCDNAFLFPVDRHICNEVDYTYHFSMQRFSSLDHFIVSGGLFDTAIKKLVSIHDVDNTSIIVARDCFARAYRYD